MSRKAPGKKEAAAQEKAAQGLYLVETRARYGDVMVSIIHLTFYIDSGESM
jgi:carbon catabolite-derepressing protein kinase